MIKFVWVSGLRDPIPEVWHIEKPTRNGEPIVPLQEHTLVEDEVGLSLTDLSAKYPLTKKAEP